MTGSVPMQLPPASVTPATPDAAVAGALQDARRLQDRREWHRAMLVVAVVIIGLSLVLSVRDDERVAVTGLTSLPLPETCGMRLLFHCDCPGCGLTRSFIHLAHGDWRRSVAVHRVGWLLAAAVALQLPYRWIALRRPAWTLSSGWAKLLLTLFITMLLLNWVFTLMQASQNPVSVGGL